MARISNTEAPLAGKVALVTGGSRGIGAAIAKRLASEGARVAITYSSSPAKAEAVVEAIVAEGGRAVALKADSGDVDAVRGAVDQAVAKLGRLDILVNNAGVSVGGPIEQIALEDFERILAVNVKGVFVATQQALKHLPRGGRIINIGSSMTEYTAFGGASAYTLTKGAVAGFTRGLVRDLGPRGITVNNVQPGPVDTDMNPADGPVAGIVGPGIAVQRYGRGEDIAGVVAYLASPQASFITGANVLVDGGLTA
jgi:3-oxoacyl-[acyl-carrier protein] reductase